LQKDKKSENRQVEEQESSGKEPSTTTEEGTSSGINDSVTHPIVSDLVSTEAEVNDTKGVDSRFRADTEVKVEDLKVQAMSLSTSDDSATPSEEKKEKESTEETSESGDIITVVETTKKEETKHEVNPPSDDPKDKENTQMAEEPRVNLESGEAISRVETTVQASETTNSDTVLENSTETATKIPIVEATPEVATDVFEEVTSVSISIPESIGKENTNTLDDKDKAILNEGESTPLKDPQPPAIEQSSNNSATETTLVEIQPDNEQVPAETNNSEVEPTKVPTSDSNLEALPLEAAKDSESAQPTHVPQLGLISQIDACLCVHLDSESEKDEPIFSFDEQCSEKSAKETKESEKTKTDITEETPVVSSDSEDENEGPGLSLSPINEPVISKVLKQRKESQPTPVELAKIKYRVSAYDYQNIEPLLINSEYRSDNREPSGTEKSNEG